MSEQITLELPSELVRQARQLALASNRLFDDAVAEWIGRGVAETPIESLPDSKILELCDGHLPAEEQEELSRLLAENKQSELGPTFRKRLDELLADYRRGLIIKGRAVNEAVSRGLIPRLTADAA
jgi:hypothetical protein